jgi:hypothetical protein
MSSRDSTAPDVHRFCNKLFPAWAEMKRLVAQIEQLERGRVQLLESEVSHLHPYCISRHALTTFQLPEIEGVSDEMHYEMKRAEDLIHMIKVFECGQNIRVQKIVPKILDTEALIDDIKEAELQAKSQMLVDVLRRGQMLPAVSSKFNWEVDTDDEDEASRPNGFSSGIFQFKPLLSNCGLTFEQQSKRLRIISET